jgi:hypothetical protein
VEGTDDRAGAGDRDVAAVDYLDGADRVAAVSDREARWIFVLNSARRNALPKCVRPGLASVLTLAGSRALSGVHLASPRAPATRWLVAVLNARGQNF